MAPFYMPGKYCLCRRINPQKLAVGDVVVAELLGLGKVIKRISEIDHLTSSIKLRGENPSSISTEKMGWVSFEQLLWKVIWPKA